MAALKHDIIIKRNEKIITSRLDDEIIMMSAESGEYYGLDPVASRIWELLENETSLTGLTEKLTEEFQVPADECLNDVNSFIEKLISKGLAHIVDNK